MSQNLGLVLVGVGLHFLVILACLVTAWVDSKFLGKVLWPKHADDRVTLIVLTLFPGANILVLIFFQLRLLWIFTLSVYTELYGGIYDR